MTDNEHPFETSSATKMLREGLQKASKERGLSTRAAAREMGYRATVVVSHMATGRVPIPLERAAEMADVVGLNRHAFTWAVLEQRYPAAAQVLASEKAGNSRSSDGVVAELQLLAGGELDQLPDEHKRVLREVVSERDPDRRWLSLPELPVVLALRQALPDLRVIGLDRGEIDKLVTVTNPSSKELRRPST